MLNSRNCFLEQELDENNRLEVASIDENFRPAKIKVSTDEVFEEIDRTSMEVHFQHKADLEILRNLYPKLCPVSLVDAEMFRWLDIEALCKEYNQLPFGDSIFELPNKIYEVLVTIVEGKSQYHVDYLQSLKDSNKG